jgi:hypothetical protein
VRVAGSQAFVWYSADVLDVLILGSGDRRKVPANALSVPMLEPLLFYLALKAGTEPGSDGQSSSAWLGKRAFRLHIAHEEGITDFSYHPADVSAEQARDYLAELVCSFLDRTGFDLLPFELAVANQVLQAPFREAGSADPDRRAEYRRAYADAIAADGEKDYPDYRPMKLMQLVRAMVPADAWDKMNRRFRLLDAGPARKRMEHKAPKGRKGRARN